MNTLRVRDAEKLISAEPILVREEVSIYETVERMIDTRHARCAYVVDEQGQLLGIVTLKALVEHIFAHHYFGEDLNGGTMLEIVHSENALQLASPQPVYVTESESLAKAVEKMLNNDLEQIPVIDGEGGVIGDINLLDLLSVWMERSAESRGEGGHERVRIARFVQKDCINLHLKARKKETALEEMFAMLKKAPQVTDVETIRRAVKAREILVTTGVGRGIAIPHGRCQGIHDCVIGVGLSQKGVDFESLDGKPVHIIFLIAASEVAGFPYAQLLSRVMHLLHSEPTQQRLLSSQTPEQLVGLLEEFDREWESKAVSKTH